MKWSISMAFISPQQYLACLCERNKAILAKDRAEHRLCELLCCTPKLLSKRLEQHKSSGRVSPLVLEAEAKLIASEAKLEQASSLYQEALAERNRKLLDRDILALDC
jgi:hypothetical protein